MSLCGGRYAATGVWDQSLKDCLTGMIVSDLKGYTQETLMAFVKGEGGPHGLVPAWLEANKLWKYLKDYQTDKKAKGS